jgi:hypothetical protein
VKDNDKGLDTWRHCLGKFLPAETVTEQLSTERNISTVFLGDKIEYGFKNLCSEEVAHGGALDVKHSQENI